MLTLTSISQSLLAAP